jgi:hypothetical protein
MNPRLSKLQVLPECRLLLDFTNGEKRIFDVGSYIRDIPALHALRSPAYFAKARVAHGTATWSDDEDICPDTLYLGSTPVEQKAA